MKIIPKSTFVEMDDDVNVESLFPDIQIDIFDSKRWRACIYIASSIYNDKLYYETYSVSTNLFFNKENEIIKELKDNLKILVLKSI